MKDVILSRSPSSSFFEKALLRSARKTNLRGTELTVKISFSPKTLVLLYINYMDFSEGLACWMSYI